MEPYPPDTGVAVSDGWIPGMGPRAIAEWLKETYTDVARVGTPERGPLSSEILAKAEALARRLNLRNRAVFLARKGAILRIFVVWWRPGLMHNGELYLRVVIATWAVPTKTFTHAVAGQSTLALAEVSA